MGNTVTRVDGPLLPLPIRGGSLSTTTPPQSSRQRGKLLLAWQLPFQEKLPVTQHCLLLIYAAHYFTHSAWWVAVGHRGTLGCPSKACARGSCLGHLNGSGCIDGTSLLFSLSLFICLLWQNTHCVMVHTLFDGTYSSLRWFKTWDCCRTAFYQLHLLSMFWPF